MDRKAFLAAVAAAAITPGKPRAAEVETRNRIELFVHVDGKRYAYGVIIVPDRETNQKLIRALGYAARDTVDDHYYHIPLEF